MWDQWLQRFDAEVKYTGCPHLPGETSGKSYTNIIVCYWATKTRGYIIKGSFKDMEVNCLRPNTNSETWERKWGLSWVTISIFLFQRKKSFLSVCCRYCLKKSILPWCICRQKHYSCLAFHCRCQISLLLPVSLCTGDFIYNKDVIYENLKALTTP